MARYTTVLFDLDGTLLDSIGLIVESFHHTFRVFGLPARSDKEWLAGIGTPLRLQLAPWAGDQVVLDRMVEVYREHNLAHHDARVRAFEGIHAAVRALGERAVKLGVVTAKNRATTRKGLVAAGLQDALRVTVCADDVVHPKPHREPVDRAVALLGADRSATLFVGDSIHDMQAGRAAGVATGAALWGPFERGDLVPAAPDHWLRTPADVVWICR